MFHSLHEVGSLHAAARAVGGCPVYVSDAPGQSDVPLLRRLVLPDGSVLRGKLPGRPTRDCLFEDVGADGERVLKIWNANAAGGVVGAYHVQGVAWSWRTRENVRVARGTPPPITAHVRPRDVETLRGEAGPFAAWRHVGSRVEQLATADTAAEVTLRHREWEIFTMVPVRHNGGISWAPLGLGEMMNSGGALLEVGELLDAPSGGACATLVCRTPGKLHAFAQPAPTFVHLEGASDPLPFCHDAESGKLEVTLPDQSGTARLTVSWSAA